MHLARLTRLAIGAVVALFSAGVSAQQPAPPPPAGHSGLGFGVKAGIGFDPEQILVGAQLSLGRTALLRVVPNVHLGFGDETTWDFNVDFLARLIFEGKRMGAFAGIAPTYTIYDGDDDFGGTVVAGLQLPLIPGKGTNIEARFGFSGAPSFRLLGALVF